MIDIDVPKELGEFVITIKYISECLLACPKSCPDSDYTCSFIEIARRNGYKFSNPHAFKAIKVVININNKSLELSWRISAKDLVLIDSMGYSTIGQIICDGLRPYKTSGDGMVILPKTQGDYIMLFPTLDNNSKISELVINTRDRLIRFHIDGEKNDINYKDNLPLNLFRSTEFYQYDVRPLFLKLYEIKTLIYSRLHNVLTLSEIIKLENKIQNQAYSLKLNLEQGGLASHQAVLKELGNAMSAYNDELKNLKTTSLSKNMIAGRVENLKELSEVGLINYVSELYTMLGYEIIDNNHKITKYINIYMRKNDKMYGVLCKKSNSTIGSPIIQNFLGAMQIAKIDKGIIVSTGMFSFEAESFAREHPIELVDRVDLARAIIDVINK